MRVGHAPGMPGTFSQPPLVSDPDMHHGICLPHVPWCMPRSLTSGFLWSRRGDLSRHSRYKCNTQFCVTSKRPMLLLAMPVPGDCKLLFNNCLWLPSTLYIIVASNIIFLYFFSCIPRVGDTFIFWWSTYKEAEHTTEIFRWWYTSTDMVNRVICMYDKCLHWSE